MDISIFFVSQGQTIYFRLINGLAVIIGIAAKTHLRTCIRKIVQTHVKLHNVEIRFFPYHKGIFLNERICFLLEQILPFKRSSHL